MVSNRRTNQALILLEPRHWDYFEAHTKEGGRSELIRKLLDDYITSHGISPEEIELRKAQLRLRRQEIAIQRSELEQEEASVTAKETALHDYIKHYKETIRKRDIVWERFRQEVVDASEVVARSSNRDHVCRTRAEMLTNKFGETYRRVTYEDLLKIANGNASVDDLKL